MRGCYSAPVDWLAEFMRFWHFFAGALALALSILASAHAVIYKRDPRSATLWVGVAWLLPLLGAVLYFTLGVNRLRRRAVLLRGHREPFAVPMGGAHVTPALLPGLLPADGRHFEALVGAMNQGKPMVKCRG